MTLLMLQTELSNKGFETTISDNILQASLEMGDLALEITIDNGGEALVVKKLKTPSKNKEFKYKGQVVPIVCEIMTSEMFRVKLENVSDLEIIEKEIQGV